MLQETISVIVPVYKVENYLNQCVESILAQTYEKLEVILVDDGSPDRCGLLCDVWAQKDNRIKVIHKQNGGLSDARNEGIKVATGTLIGFVDGDDWIAQEMYQLLYNQMKNTDSDISACGVQKVWENGTTQLMTRKGCIVLDKHQAMQALIEESWLKQPVWYKLYKRSVIEGIFFEVGKCHEDVFWMYQPLNRAERVCVIDIPCYYYRQRNDSIMGEELSIKRLDGLVAMMQRAEFLKDSYPELLSDAQIRTYFYGIFLMQWALRDKKRELVLELKQIINRIDVREVRGISSIKRAWIIFSKISLTGMCKVRNLLKIGI